MKKLITGAFCILVYFALMLKADIAQKMHELYTTGSTPDHSLAYVAIFPLLVGLLLWGHWLRNRLKEELS